jgi:deoxyribose-phosphate aldolase
VDQGLAVPIGLLLDDDDASFRASVAAVVDAVAPVPVKAMLELPLLTPQQRDRAVDLAIDAGVT